MNSRASKPLGRIALLCLVEAGLLAALWWGANRQLAGMNAAVNDIAELMDPSPFRAALMGHLGKIHLGLQGYLHSPDPSLLDQVAQSRKDFYASLPEFEKQNPKLFPKIAVEEILRTFNVFKESIDHTLEATSRRGEQRGQLDQNFAQIITIIDKNIRPLVKPDQPDGEERKEAILNIENLARAWQQNLVKAWEQPSHAATELTFENENRGETYVERYGRMELLPREKKLQKELAKIWQINSDLARESFAREQVVNEAGTFMDAQRNQVITALNKYLPAMPPQELQDRKTGFIRRVRLHGAAACVIALLAAISLWYTATGSIRLKQGLPLWVTKPKPVRVDTPHETTLHMDLKGTISHWSGAAEKLYGYPAKEMKGKSIAVLFESESEISRLYKELLEAPQTTFETIHKVKGGNAIPIRIEFRPISDAAGHTTGIGLVCTRR